jgi:uncharacterized protein (PEP-CTERM system associated)
MMTLRTNATFAAASLIALAVSAPAEARKKITPYLEVGQVATASLSRGGDVLTYSTAAAGVDVSISNSRAELGMNYRYERRFGWGKRVDDVDTHSGLIRGSYQVVPNMLSVEGGAIATRSRNDIRGAAPGTLVGNVDNVSQVYSAYVGPTLSTHVGDLAVGASYRLGYTKVESSGFVPQVGQPQLDQFDSSVSHQAGATVGMAPGRLPFGWTVSGAYSREDSKQLDQRFESKGVEGNITVPLSPTVAAVGAVGYEKITASQRDAVRDATGAPVIGAGGRYVTDPASPRLLAYNQAGLYWNAGVSWRPSRRTSLEARVGRRYDSWSFTGSLSHQLSESTAVQVGVFDGIQTFGRQLTDNLSRLPTSFSSGSNPLAPQYAGCVYGNPESGGAGGCLDSSLQSINTSVYRSRGVAALISSQRGPLRLGAGLGYTRRTYKTPLSAGNFALNNLSDDSFTGQAQVGYQIDAQSSIDGEVYAGLYRSGILNAPQVTTVGGSAAYQRRFGQHLTGTAAVGLNSNKVSGQQANTTASGLIGLRYGF